MTYNPVTSNLNDIDEASYPAGIRDGLFWREADDIFALQTRVNYVRPYTEGPTYHLDDMVSDGAWLMSANKTTTERAAPQLSGVTEWVSELAGAPPAFTTLTFVDSVCVTGNRFTFPSGGRISAYRWYAPDASSNFTYEVWQANSTGDQTLLLAAHVPTAVGWNTIPKSVDVAEGTILDLVVIGRAVIQPNIIDATWQVENKNGNPDNEKATFQNNATEIRIDYDPKSGSAAGLQAAAAAGDLDGGTMEYQGVIWTISSGTDDGAFCTLNLSPNQGRPSENETNIKLSYGSSDPIPYVLVANHYAAYPNVTGFLDDEYPPAVQDDGLYGVDILVDAYTASDDWDVVSFTGGDSGAPVTGSFGISIIQSLTAETVRNLLGVDEAGTDNSIDVTLSGSGSYISIVGQVITVDPITESDISDLGPYDPAGTDNSTDVTLAGTGTYISIVGQVITVDPITESDISDLNPFTPADETKLDGIEAGADVTDEANVSATASVIANTAKVTNATHTGEVAGSGALTLDETAISNKDLETALGSDHALVNRAGVLKKILVSDLLVSGDISCKATKTADQSIPKNILTMITWDSEEYDTDGMHDNVTNNSRITFNTAGKYSVLAQADWGINSGGFRFLEINKNGSGIARVRYPADNASENIIAYVGEFAVGDFIELGVFQDTGGNLDFESGAGVENTYLEAHKIN